MVQDWQLAEQAQPNVEPFGAFSTVGSEPVAEYSVGACRVTASWLAGGGDNGFGSFDLDLNRTWLVPCGAELEPLAVSPGVGLHFWSGPNDLDLPPRVYDLYLDLSWRAVAREHCGIAVGFTPGFYGDFEQVDSQTFQMTGWLLGNYRFGPRWNVLGGLAYVRQLESNLLPIGGVVWTPSEDVRAEILVPRPRLAQRIAMNEDRETWVYVAGQFGGGAWAVADTSTENVLVGYSDLRFLLGLELLETSGCELVFEAGYVFSRQISVNNVTVREPGSTVVLQAAAAF
jgi:hypothetical protein